MQQGLVNSLPLLEAIKKVREQVFVKEQEIDSSLEFDSNDLEFKQKLEQQVDDITKSQSIRYYYISLPGNGEDKENEICGTCRARRTTESSWKIERVATLKAHRGKGLGQALISFALANLSESTSDKTTTFYIHAQLSAFGFWNGGVFNGGKFIKVGDDFEEANIPHCKMIYHPPSL